MTAETRGRRWLRAVTPPVVVAGVQRLKRRGAPPARPEWEYVPEGWARARDDVRGWNVESVVDAYRRKLPAFRAAVAGPGPLAIATSAAVPVGEQNATEQNQILAFAYALFLASRDATRVSILDWGGGVGYFSLLARSLLPATVEVEYHCKEVPLVCDAGRELLPDVTFWSDDTCLDRTYDLVFASSALQYSEPWPSVLAQLAGATGRYFFLTQVPVVVRSPSFVVLQRANHYEFETEYLSWVFNRQELLDAAAGSGLSLAREFLLALRPDVVGAPEPDETRAYLFSRAG